MTMKFENQRSVKVLLNPKWDRYWPTPYPVVSCEACGLSKASFHGYNATEMHEKYFNGLPGHVASISITSGQSK
jgi:hypothetical protein